MVNNYDGNFKQVHWECVSIVLQIQPALFRSGIILPEASCWFLHVIQANAITPYMKAFSMLRSRHLICFLCFPSVAVGTQQKIMRQQKPTSFFFNSLGQLVLPSTRPSGTDGCVYEDLDGYCVWNDKLCSA